MKTFKASDVSGFLQNVTIDASEAHNVFWKLFAMDSKVLEPSETPESSEEHTVIFQHLLFPLSLTNTKEIRVTF